MLMSGSAGVWEEQTGFTGQACQQTGLEAQPGTASQGMRKKAGVMGNGHPKDKERPAQAAMQVWTRGLQRGHLTSS